MTWVNLPKTSSSIDRGRILTPDSLQILVGGSEDLVLIFQEGETLWSNRLKNLSTGWTKKLKS